MEVIFSGMKKIRVAVVGCGNIGKRHIAILKESNTINLVGICDKDPLVIAEQIALYGEVDSYSNYQSLLDEVEADLIAICTPHGQHCQMSIQALEHGFDVLCEKPMALSLAECVKMNETQFASGKNLWVVHQNRYNIPIKYTKEAIDKGKLGKVFMIQCNVIWNRNESYYSNSDWRGKKISEGGALHTQASHFIDLMTWWFGEIISAQTSIDTKNHNIEIEDCGVANLTFNTGVMGNIFWTTNAYPFNYEGSITIIAEKGTIKIGGKYLNELEYWKVEDCPLPQNIDFSDKPNTYDKYTGSSSNHDKLYEELVKYYQGEDHLLVSGREAISTSKAIDIIYNGVD